MAAEQLWKIKVDGKEYELRTEDLTVGNLRHCKQWFGKEYGAYLPFIQMLIQGDCDAIACAIWMARRAAGERPPEPSQMGDFIVSDFFTVTAESDDEPEPDPTTPDPTPDSQPTSESSGSDTSSTSSTSED